MVDLSLPQGVKLPRLNFSIHNTLVKTGSLVYDHDVGLLENNRQAKLLQNRIDSEIKDRSSKKTSRSSSKLHSHSPSNYNKWYIDPSKRYISIPKNPKQTVASQNPQYIYNNLHNKQFWEWVHPFEVKSASTELAKDESKRDTERDTKEQEKERQREKGVERSRLNMRILQEFKKTMEDSKKRVPLIIEEMFVSKR